jgi:hypothetical protein
MACRRSDLINNPISTADSVPVIDERDEIYERYGGDEI